MNLKGIDPVDLGENKKFRINRVQLIGVELEGGWDKPVPVEHDGSVQGLKAKVMGEIPSPPLALEPLKNWMREYYPPHINETCGMHVHQSVISPLTYQRLMDPKYAVTVIHYFREWGKKVKLPPGHPIWDRLDGKSEYCQPVFDADMQVLNVDKDRDRRRKGHRYTVVNYCWGRTGTFEVRLLPMMPTVDLAIAAVEELVNITNGFLIATAKRDKKHQGEAVLKGKELRENRDIRGRF